MTDRYVKTPKGVEEVSQRTHGLAQRLRRLLILVDGKRVGADFGAMLPGEDAAAALRQLVDDGFIQLLEPPPEPAAAAAAPAAAPANRAQRPADDVQRFDMARNFMLNTLNVFVGIAASGLINRVEACADIAALQENFVAWRDAIKLSSDGRKRIDELEGKLAPLLS